jgi:hypothetical protein
MKKNIGLIIMAILFANASYAEESRESAFEQMARECRSGRNVACGVVGVYYVKGEDTFGNKTPQDIVLGLTLVSNSCNEGSLSACNSLAGYYEDGKYIQENKYKAAQIFQTVCDTEERVFIISSSGSACWRLGLMTEKGEGVPKNKYKALELYNKACALGIQHGCDSARYLKEK